MDHDPSSYEVWSRNHGRISIHWISQTVSSQILCHKLLVKLDLRWICSPCFYEYIITNTNAISIPLPGMVLTALQERSPTHDSSKSEFRKWRVGRGYFSLARSGVLHAKRCSSWRRPPRHKRRSSGNARRRLKGWQRGPLVFEKRITFWNKTWSVYFNPCKSMVILRGFKKITVHSLGW